MEKSHFSELAVRWGTWAKGVRSSRFSQLGWSFSALWCLAGLLLLTCRIQGSFLPDPDALRALGTMILMHGILVTVNWLLLLPAKKKTLSLDQILLWPGLSYAGNTAATLAMLPLASSGTALISIGLLFVPGILITNVTLTALMGFTESQQMTSPFEQTKRDAEKFEAELNSPAQSEGASSKSSHEHVVQWLSRKHEPDGQELIEGMVQVELAAGQTQQSAHVSFTPSMSEIPELECEPLGDADVEVTLGDVYSHGFRLEVRRTSTNREEETVDVGFQAVCHSPQKNAA